MSKPAKPAIVRYYVDADVLGLAKILVQVIPEGDVTYPGDPGGSVKGGRVPASCTITQVDTDDEIWIPETARQGWLVITRDRHIQDHRAEIEAVRSSGARMVNLAGEEAIDTFAQLEVLMSQWRRITSLLEEEGPFIYSLTRTKLRRIEL